MRSASSASDLGSLGRLLLPLALAAGAAVILSRGLVTARLDYAILAAAAGAIFILVFLKTELGLYLVILSMLLSPEFAVGGGVAERRQVVFRTEDFLLLVIAVSWLAKTAVNKELGLVLKTPLNRPIFAYVAVNAIATTLGALTGTVHGISGFFYVLKYVEYFVVYFIVVNNVSERAQVRRLILVAFVTAALASLVGIAQIPSGQRVSAPFEGEEGEPNTFGGYLLFIMALLLGLALETPNLRTRLVSLALTGLCLGPFAFTLSRASYLGFVPMLGALAVLSSRRRLVVTTLVFALTASPLFLALAPDPVVKRVRYTFEPEADQPTVRLGKVGFDPSTSARLISFSQALEGWQRRPILGYGVTGFGFMDAQYARTLVETGVIGLAAFLWMVVAVVRLGIHRARSLTIPEDRGLAVGFTAGTIGLLTHAIGANSFIIVRVMEPFWLFAGIVVLLPTLAGSGGALGTRLGARSGSLPPARSSWRIAPPPGSRETNGPAG
ncbi:MAG: O-antigen ligase family protein [Candidatus Rokubacteria bacterium]|nr:O-antigen ligase family protein [Candidatus Rokubacteria bacterium]